jgi:hypothetical protein
MQTTGPAQNSHNFSAVIAENLLYHEFSISATFITTSEYRKTAFSDVLETIKIVSTIQCEKQGRIVYGF